MNRFDDILLKSIKERLPELKKLYEDISSHWGEEDCIYRFYHHSFKVYWIQNYTMRVYTILKELSPNDTINEMTRKIVEEGTGKEFNYSHNLDWMNHTRPMIEAFYHMKYFLEMVIKYSSLEEAPCLLPSGWAAVLHLFNIR
jgi:hypothetical protein